MLVISTCNFYNNRTSFL